MPKKSEENKEKTEQIEEVKHVQDKISAEEFEKKVIELSKEGLTSEKIGEKLRKEGIHSQAYEKKISKILKEKDLYSNPDLKNIEKKLENLEAHYKKNKQDKKAKKQREKIHGNYRKLKSYLEKK